VTIGSSTLKVGAPRSIDLPPEQEPFESILKPYQKRPRRRLPSCFPGCLLKDLATRDFEPAMRGSQVALSPSTIALLNGQFKTEYEQ
jgi:hypothetical protein